MAIAVHNQNSAVVAGIRRVYYSGTGTILEGMAVCYNSDRTTDMDGTTVAAGTTNNGRFMDVEDPKAANMRFFAGVVKAGSYGSTTGPAWLDIYTPNGESVTARGTDSFTNGEKVYIAAGDSEITNVPQAGGFIGYAMDTIDRSTTEGLLLIKMLDTAEDIAVTTVTNKVTADSPVAVTVADAGQTFTNTGAAGAIEFDLPTAASAAGLEYTFSVTDGTSGNTMAIDPNSTEVIKFGNGTDVLGAGELLTLTPGDVNDNGLSITLVSNGTAWVAKNAFATAVTLFVIP